MNNKNLLFAIFLGLSCISIHAQAEIQHRIHLVRANTIINNLDVVIKTVKQQSSILVRFPALVPKTDSSKKYFSSADLTRKSQGIDYLINIDSTEDCNGIHYCNIGTVRAKSGAKPETYLDRDNKIITYPVILDNHLKGYFTPGHAMADYFSANIQWQEKGVLYQITWDTNKETIIKMANSAINMN
jgi:hypothetical protein